MDKKWYLSKTLWFAVLTVVIGVAQAYGFAAFEPNPELAQLLPAIVVVIVGVVNFILRTVTKEKLVF